MELQDWEDEKTHTDYRTGREAQPTTIVLHFVVRLSQQSLLEEAPQATHYQRAAASIIIQ